MKELIPGLVILSLLLQGCASVLTHNSMEGLPAASPQERPTLGSTTLVVFRRHDVQNKSVFYTSLRKDTQLESAVVSSALRSGLFSDIRPVSFPEKDYQDMHSSEEKVHDFVWELAKANGTDSVLVIYQYWKASQFPLHPDPLLFIGYAAWGLLSFATLGLVPVKAEMSTQLQGELWSKDGKLISKTDFSASVDQWFWTPLALRKDSQPGVFNHKPMEDFSASATDILLRKLNAAAATQHW